jgi:proline iminopeptidase
MVCPVDQALALKQRWEEAEVKIICDAGHAITEHGIAKALVNCTNAMLEIVS